mmetsp:Transcript_15612/g.33820  ORF Transcript_15612/g.33820 Transcript_15612/m.33820 type:complete len:342 (-) Transcript_15612:71-1096(-)
MRFVCVLMVGTALLVPYAAITAAAFGVNRPPGISRLMIKRHHHTIGTRLSPHLSILRAQSTHDEMGNEHDDSTASQINQALEKLQEELLSDPAKLKPIKQQHEISNDDRVLTQEELIRRTILSTRLLNLNLNRTRLAESTLDGAGRGLFATENIGEGDIITCYPGDALFCDYSEEETEVDYEDDDEDSHYADKVARWREHVRTLSPIWGEHISDKDRIEKDAVNDGIQESSIPPLTSYAVSVDDVYTVMGMPTLDKDPAYYGHFANDGAGHLILEKGDGSMGVEECISEYIIESIDVSNAMQRPLEGGLHMVAVALRDIEDGEEILMTYGPDYWTAHAQRG